jgi:hypothetical protein
MLMCDQRPPADGTAMTQREIAALKRERAALGSERWAAAIRAPGPASLAARWADGAGLADGRLAEITARLTAIEARLAELAATIHPGNRGKAAA